MIYNKVGYDNFLNRSIVGGVQTQIPTSLESMISESFAFDRQQISGSLGDKIQVGGRNLILDGSGSRIIIRDEENNVITIGKV